MFDALAWPGSSGWIELGNRTSADVAAIRAIETIDAKDAKLTGDAGFPGSHLILRYLDPLPTAIRLARSIAASARTSFNAR